MHHVTTMQKKGGLSALRVILTVLLIVFIVAMVWLIYDKPISDLSNKVRADLDPASLVTFNKMMGFWHNWPIYTIITAMIAGVVMIVWNRGNDSTQPPF